jgi:hypothetical protein
MARWPPEEPRIAEDRMRMALERGEKLADVFARHGIL